MYVYIMICHGLIDLFIHLFIYSFIQITYGIHYIYICIYATYSPEYTPDSVYQGSDASSWHPRSRKALEVNDGNLG